MATPNQRINPLDAYAEKAADYALYRLDYAPEAIGALIKRMGLDSDWVVADIGSGTGNLSRHLVDRVQNLFAVEPNAAMRYQAERLLSDHAAFVSIVGRAEQTTLLDCSIDLIVVGQALHWFDPSAAKHEFSRILKQGGWLAVIWNRFGAGRDPDIGFYFAPHSFERCSYSMSVRQTWQQFIGGARSAAGAPGPRDPAYDTFEDEQRQRFDVRAVDGLITVDYSSELVVGRPHRPSG